MAGYFETKFGSQLINIRDSFKHTKEFSPLQELTLNRLFQSADAELSYGMLERINRKKDEYYTIFNTNVSAKTQTDIRLFLLKQYIFRIDYKGLDVLSNKVEKKNDSEIKFLLFNGKVSIDRDVLLVFLGEQLIRLKGEFALEVVKAMTESRLTDKSFLRQTGTDSKSLDRATSKISKALFYEETPLTKIKSLSEIDTEAFKLNVEDRKSLEELVLLVNGLNHSEYIAALLQFRIDGLEKRVKALEDANQTSFFGFLTDLLLTFVVPFGIGKLAEAAILKAVSKSTKSAYASAIKDSKIYDFAKAAKLDAEVYDDIIEGQKLLQAGAKTFHIRFNSLPSTIKSHLDDYAQFTADAAVKIRGYRSAIKTEKPKANDLNSFIQFTIETNRDEIINLKSEISQFKDRDLAAELSKCLNLKYTFYYEKMNAELAKYEAEQKRLREEADKKRRLADAIKAADFDHQHFDTGPIKQPDGTTVFK